MSEDDSRQDADSAERSGDKPRRSWLDRISAALSGEPTTREDLVELLRDACRRGAVALNYAPVVEIVADDGVARGVRLRDRIPRA